MQPANVQPSRICTLCDGKKVVGPFGGPKGPRFPCSRCGGTGAMPRGDALPVPQLLEAMAKTFRERNAQYGDNWKMVGKVMEVLFPNGVTLKSAADYDVWHLFELKVVKLTRFAISDLTHIDSIHDDAVYSAMINAILEERKSNGK